MNQPQEFKLTEDEQALLKLAAESEQFILQPMWKKIEIFLNAWVAEALDDMRGSLSSDPVVAIGFKRVWNQREILRDSLIAFVKGPIADRKELLNQIEEQRKAGLIYHAGTNSTDDGNNPGGNSSF
jgi:hypothetical protein